MTVDNDDRLGELAQWITDAASGAKPASELGPPELVETWYSRTATLHHFSWPAASVPDLVVKLHRTADDAEAHFQSMRYVAQALEDARQHGVAVIRPIDVSLDLNAVSMPFVPGDSLSEHLVHGDWWSRAVRDEIHRLVHRCGALLAAYHNNQPEAYGSPRREAGDRLKSRIERVLEQEVDLTSVAATGPVVKCYRDFHPGHVIVTPDRQLALIDPPIETRYDYFYRDLALFSHSVFMALIDPHRVLRVPLRLRQRASLRRALLEGYASAANRKLTDDDMFYVRGYEAYYLARMLRKLRRRRSYSVMAYYSAPMRRRLRDLRRVLSQYLEHSGQQRG